MANRQENQTQAVIVLKLLNTAQKDLLTLAAGMTEGDDAVAIWQQIAEYLQTATETAAENIE